MTVVIPLPWERPPLTSNRVRGNPIARAREVAKAKDEARWAIRTKRLAVAATPVEITLHYRQPDRRRRDADGLAPTYKVCADALVQEGVLADDNSTHVPAMTIRLHPPTHGDGEMWLEIKEIA